MRALDQADPLTLDQIYAVVDRDLAARNLPRPQRRAVNTAGDLALSRGPATRPPTEPPDSDAVRFTFAYHPPTKTGLRLFGAVFHVLGFYLLSFISSLLLSVVLIAPSPPSDTGVDLVLVFGALTPLIPIAVTIARPRSSPLGRAVSVIKARLVSGETEPDVRVRELVVDRSGLTIRGTLARTHLPW